MSFTGGQHVRFVYIGKSASMEAGGLTRFHVWKLFRFWGGLGRGFRFLVCVLYLDLKSM